MSYSRGRFYAFWDARTNNLEINFPQDTAYEHSRRSKCAGHLFNEEDVKEIISICEQYLEDLKQDEWW